MLNDKIFKKSKVIENRIIILLYKGRPHTLMNTTQHQSCSVTELRAVIKNNVIIIWEFVVKMQGKIIRVKIILAITP